MNQKICKKMDDEKAKLNRNIQTGITKNEIRAEVDEMLDFGPSVDDQAVSLSDDGTTIIIDFWSERR